MPIPYTHSFFDLFFLGVLGLVFGSFANAFVWRLHEQISLIRGRSMCPNCRVTLPWHDLVPVLSYVVLGGRCRSCRVFISVQYPVVEIAFACLFIIAGIVFREHSPYGVLGAFDGLTSLADIAGLFLTLFFLTTLLLLFVYDLRWYVLPDLITIPAIIVGYVANGFLFVPQGVCVGSGISCLLSISWVNLLCAGIVGGGFFLAQYVISQGRWIGGGDIRLGVLMGVILGYPGVLVALFLAYMMGSLVGIALLAARRKGMKSEVPFGPFLTLATVITMFFQKDLLTMLSALSVV